MLLRRWRAADLDPFAEINPDPRVVEWLPALLSRRESDSLAALIESHFEGKGLRH